jgi:hypothetical protein
MSLGVSLPEHIERIDPIGAVFIATLSLLKPGVHHLVVVRRLAEYNGYCIALLLISYHDFSLDSQTASKR